MTTETKRMPPLEYPVMVQGERAVPMLTIGDHTDDYCPCQRCVIHALYSVVAPKLENMAGTLIFVPNRRAEEMVSVGPLRASDGSR
jgi:hypothetical protein